MPTVIVMVAVVATLTEAIKTFLGKVKVVVKGTAAVALAVVCSAGTVGYYWVVSGDPFSFALVTTFIEVALAATIGYKFVTEKIGNNR